MAEPRAMAESIAVSIAGEPMLLLADRALYWPARRRLVIADLHLGKGGIFRSAGIAVPSGGTALDLKRIARLLEGTGAGALWILGDFLHGHRSPAQYAAWAAFRAAHAQVAMAVVLGNHDRTLDAQAAGLDVLPDGVADGPVRWQHHPCPVPGAHVVCGHVHPVLRLPRAGRWPLFWLREQMTVLPAFSAFTGGYEVPRTQAGGSVVCNGDSVALLP